MSSSQKSGLSWTELLSGSKGSKLMSGSVRSLTILKRTQARKCSLKKLYFFIFSNFSPYFCVQWTCTPVEMNQCTKIPYWWHKQHHFCYLKQFLAMKMAISHSENWLKNQNFVIFSTFFYIFVSNGSVYLWKWINASKYLTRTTSSTIFGRLEQFSAWKRVKKWRFSTIFWVGYGHFQG